MKQLEEYNQKRDFKKSQEPVGRIKQGGKKRRFVVQLHEARRRHYDFRLEHDGYLLSWAVPKGPSFNPLDRRLAIMVEAHPLDYRTFEGVIPAGQYGAGPVMVWDSGVYQEEAAISTGLKKGSLEITLFGKRLKGKWHLVKANRSGIKDGWLLIKGRDQYARNLPEIDQFTTSIKTGKTLAEIQAEN